MSKYLLIVSKQIPDVANILMMEPITCVELFPGVFLMDNALSKDAINSLQNTGAEYLYSKTEWTNPWLSNAKWDKYKKIDKSA